MSRWRETLSATVIEERLSRGVNRVDKREPVRYDKGSENTDFHNRYRQARNGQDRDGFDRRLAIIRHVGDLSLVNRFYIALVLVSFAFACGSQRNGEISGIVQLQGQPNSEGIQIFLPGTQFRAITDQNGAFKIVEAPPGAYTLVAQFDGYEEHRQEIEIAPRASSVLEPILLRKIHEPKGSLAGFLRLSGQSTHQDILVLLVGTNHSTATNTTGYFKIDGIAPGSYTVLALKEGHHPMTKEKVEIVDGEETTLEEFQLQAIEPTPTPVPEPPKLGDKVLQGYAFLEDEENHSGIRVALESIPEKFAITDASGMFQLTHLDDGPYTLVLSKEGFLDERIADASPVEATSAQSCGIVSLQKEYSPEALGVLQGRVYLENQTDHANSTVRLLGMSPPVFTDAGGRFQFVGIPAGQYVLIAEHVGYETERVPNIYVYSNQISQAPDIILSATGTIEQAGTGTIEGTALLEGEQDHTGIIVMVEGTELRTITDYDGRFSISDAPMGAYTLVFTRGGYKNEYLDGVIVEAGQTLPLEPVILLKDVDPPYVMDTFPRHRARRVPIVGFVDVLVRFSERMNGQSVKQSVIIEPPVAYEAFFDRESEMSDLDVLHLRLYQRGNPPLMFNTTYHIVITPMAQTPKGVPMVEPFGFVFTTDGPLIFSSMPAERQTEFLVTGPRKLLFETNAPVDLKSMERALRITPQPDSIPMIEPMPSDLGWRILVDVDLRPNSRYRVQITNALRTIDGQRFSNTPYSLQFRTIESTPGGDEFRPGMPPIESMPRRRGR